MGWTHVSANGVSFVPKEWRQRSDAQQRMLIKLMRDGPQIVEQKTRRTAIVLFRLGLVEYDQVPSYPPLHPNDYVRTGVVLRASGKAWELYREFQQGQAVGDTFVDVMRSMRR